MTQPLYLDWSAPLAIRIHTNSQNAIQPLQETILLFMSDASCSALVAKSSAVFNQTLRFSPGPFGYAPYDPAVDVFAYVRFNQGFTPAELVMNHMNGWSICQDEARHEFWHGVRCCRYILFLGRDGVSSHVFKLMQSTERCDMV